MTSTDVQLLRITAANGVPFTVVLTPAGDTPPPFGKRYDDSALVSFFDARYTGEGFTEYGQAFGAQYAVDTLLGRGAWSRGRIGEHAGLDLHGGVDAWTLDQHTARKVADWLDRHTDPTLVPLDVERAADLPSADPDASLSDADTVPQDNYLRALWAADAVKAFATATGTNDEDVATVVGDLLVNLRHLADSTGLDFDGLVAAGRRTHADERAGR